MEPERLLTICARYLAPRVTKQDLKHLPSDLYEELQKHMDRDRQIDLFGVYKRWDPNSGQLRKRIEYNELRQRHGKSEGWGTDGHYSWYEELKNGRNHGVLILWSKRLNNDKKDRVPYIARMFNNGNYIRNLTDYEIDVIINKKRETMTTTFS